MKPSGRYCIIPCAGINSNVSARYATPAPVVRHEEIPISKCYTYDEAARESDARKSAETIRPGKRGVQ